MLLENFRSQKIIWDRANKTIFEKIEANSGDSNGRNLVVQVINQGVTENLLGTTLSLGWKYRKGAKGLDAFNVVDASKGIFEIYYTTEMLSNIGNIEASLILIDSTGRIESSTFTISVTPSTVDDESVESENSFTALTEALVKVNDLEGNYAPRLNEVTAQLAQNEQYTVDELNKKALKTETNAQLFELNSRVNLKVGGGKKAEPEDLSARTLGLINGTGGTVNLLSIPQDKSVTDKKFENSLLEKLTLNTTNLAPNSDFSDGTTNWTRTDGTSSVAIEDGQLSLTGSGTNSNTFVYGDIPSKVSGHEYYYRVEMKPDQQAQHLRIYSGADIAYLQNPNPETFHVVSGVGQYNTNQLFSIYTNYPNAASALGKKTKIRNIQIIDLTEMFAPNARPSKEIIDYIFSKHDSSAFNGTKNILSSRKTLVSQAQKELDFNSIVGDGVIQGLNCYPNGGLSIRVEEGKVLSDFFTHDVAAKTLNLDPADSTNERTDLIYIDNTGVLRVKKGTAVAWLELPKLPEDGMAIAEIRIPPNSIDVISANIVDRRIFIKPARLSGKVSTVVVAASNSSPQDKRMADYVCDGVNDEIEIQKAVDSFVRTSGKVMLANGDYYIDSLFYSGHPNTGSFGVVMKRPDIQREVKIEGVTAPLRKLGTSNDLHNAPIIRMRKSLYDSLEVDELVTMIGVLPTDVATGSIAYPSISLVTNNLGIVIPDNKKNTRMIDSYYTSMYKCDGFLGMYQVHTGHNQKAEGIRGLRGMNFGTGYEISNCFIWGAGIAYNISGEHLIMKNCGVRFSLYPFAFGLTPEQERNAHPITLINCCHEACVNSIIFGFNPNKQSITFIDHNLEHSLQVQEAIELQKGAFCGSVEYAVVGWPGAHDYINVDYKFWEEGHGVNFRTRNIVHKESGTTDERPNYPNRNQTFFDTTLNKMIIYIDGVWKDAMGIIS